MEENGKSSGSKNGLGTMDQKSANTSPSYSLKSKSPLGTSQQVVSSDKSLNMKRTVSTSQPALVRRSIVSSTHKRSPRSHYRKGFMAKSWHMLSISETESKTAQTSSIPNHLVSEHRAHIHNKKRFRNFFSRRIHHERKLSSTPETTGETMVKAKSSLEKTNNVVELKVPHAKIDLSHDSLYLIKMEHKQITWFQSAWKKLKECVEKAISRISKYIFYLSTTPKAIEWAIWDYCLRAIDICFLLHFVVFDVLSMLRVIFNFIRPVYDEYGELITDFKGIREYYFRKPLGKFELLGAIPFDWIIIFISISRGTYSNDFTCRNPWYCYEDHTFSKVPLMDKEISYHLRYDYHIADIPSPLLVFSLLRVNKLFSTLSTLRWIYFLKLEKYINGPILKLLKNLLAWQLLSHIDSCIFWLMQTCVDPSHRFIKRWYIVVDHSGHPTEFYHRIISNLHTAQKSLFFLQREVDEFEEYLFQSIETLFAAVIFGSTLGNLNSIMRLFNSEAALDKEAKTRNFKLKYLSQYMIENDFPVELQKKILGQELFDWNNKKGVDTNELFRGLPKSLRTDVSTHLYYGFISKVPIFEKVERSFKVAMCERISVVSVCKGFYICKVGDIGTEMYFLKAGSVEILNQEETKIFVTLRTGSFFGEIALLEDSRRTATIRTGEDSQLCLLKKSDFHEILTDYPEVVQAFRAIIEEKKAKDAKRKQDEEEEKKRKQIEEEEAKKRQAEEEENKRKQQEEEQKRKEMEAKKEAELAQLKQQNSKPGTVLEFLRSKAELKSDSDANVLESGKRPGEGSKKSTFFSDTIAKSRAFRKKSISRPPNDDDRSQMLKSANSETGFYSLHESFRSASRKSRESVQVPGASTVEESNATIPEETNDNEAPIK